MKKIKMPGDNISLKTKKTEDELVMQWLNAQTNLMDSLRYLMEKEIVQNGIRNLQAHVPAERSVLQGATNFPMGIETQAFVTGNEQSAAAAEIIEETEETLAVTETNPSAEEEFDDEDIEAWS